MGRSFREDFEDFSGDHEGEGPGDFDGGDLFDERFADPGGTSSLRASSKTNPRNLPCPSCEEPNRLTPADRRHGYQCDACADRDERGGY